MPAEAACIASLPHDYLEFIAETDASDEFAFKVINMGIYSFEDRGCY